MEVILLQKVANLGNIGERVKVRSGYGRNFLIPRKLAVLAGRGVEAEAKRIQDAAARRESKERDQAKELAEEIDNKTVVVRLKVGAEDKVFGAITNEDISTAIKQQHQVEVDRRRVELKEPLKQLGEHQVTLRLHRDIDAHINLIITRDR